YVLTRELNALNLPGAVFRETWFTPTFSKHQGERCGGCQLHVTNRESFRSSVVTLAILETVRKLHGGELGLHDDYFDKVMGTSTVREQFLRGVPSARIAEGWSDGLAAFAQLRESFLLYR